MPRRFFAAVDFSTGDFVLSGAEAHHLVRVLRVKVGERVWFFDGTGSEVLAEVMTVTDASVLLNIVERRRGAAESRVPLTIAAAVPKGDRFSWMIEKLTELGVQRVIPLIAKRSIVDPGQGKLDKLRRTIIEASKQCGRATLMELAEPQSWLACMTHEFPNHAVYLAHPSGEACDWQELRANALQADHRPPLFLIGPEGGFTDAEVEQALDCGGKLVALGATILRIETAAVAIAALAGLIT